MRKLIWISIALSAAGLVWGQRGRGVGQGSQGAPAALPSQAKAPAAQKPVKAPTAKPTAKPPAAPKTWTTRLGSDSALAARLTPLLPEGTALPAAAEGFRNQGQFIAALHVSKNLNIPFADLKTQMTGTEKVSLGKAVQTLRPDLDKATVNADVKQAEDQAEQDLRAK
jgi:hypothetical protein